MFQSVRSHGRRHLVAAAILAGSALAGCQEVPTAPPSDLSAQSKASPLGGGKWVTTNPRSRARPAGLTDSGTKTFDVHAKDGGKFTFGRYTLTVPKNALEADGQITISVGSGSIVGCGLSISPDSLNGFLKPVTLSINCSGTNVTSTNITGLAIFWRTQGGWLNVGGIADPTTLTVSADLWHFSDYRAGW